jgi:hypothetical protein
MTKAFRPASTKEAQMQAAVEAIVGLGPLPASAVAEVPTLEMFERLLQQVSRPVSDTEATVLCGLFGPDDCFGLAWSLLHLIETAPGWPMETELALVVSPWQVTLRQRL